MNKHFEEAIENLKQAGDTAADGISAEVQSVHERVSDLIDREESDPQQGRFDEVRQELEDLQRKAEGETKSALRSARERLEQYRDERNA